MIKKRSFFPLFYIIVTLFSLALFAGCSGAGEADTDKRANSKQAVKMDKAEKRVNELKKEGADSANTYDDSGTREEAASVESLIELLMSQDTERRQKGLRALDRVGGSAFADVVDALTEMLNDEDASTVVAAAEALGKIASERSVDGLRVVMINNADKNITEAAAKALGAIAAAGSEAAVDALITGLNFGRKYGRYNAANELGKIKSTHPHVTKALKEATKDEERLVQDAALQALRGGGKETRKAISRVSRSHGNYRDGYKRYRAVKELGKNGSPEAVADLIEILQSDSNFNIRSAALTALKKSAGKRLLEVTKIALQDSYYQIRVDAVYILAEIESPEALALIIETLDSKDLIVREAAIRGLRKRKSPEAFAALIRFSKDQSKDSSSRTKAIEALGDATDSEKALNALIGILSSESETGISRQAAASLGHFRTPRAESALINAVKNHKNSSARRTAVFALRHFKTPKVIDALFGALKDKDRLVTVAAIRILVGFVKADNRIADKFINALIALYEEGEVEWAVHQAATGVLFNLGTPKATEALEKIRELRDSH